MEEIKNIEELVKKSNTGIIVNRIRESKEELNQVRELLGYINSSRLDESDYELNNYYRMLTARYYDYLKDKIEVMEKLNHKLTNKLLGLTNVTTTKKQVKPKKQVADYTSSDDVDMLI